LTSFHKICAEVGKNDPTLTLNIFAGSRAISKLFTFLDDDSLQESALKNLAQLAQKRLKKS